MIIMIWLQVQNMMFEIKVLKNIIEIIFIENYVQHLSRFVFKYFIGIYYDL